MFSWYNKKVNKKDIALNRILLRFRIKAKLKTGVFGFTSVQKKIFMTGRTGILPGDKK